MYFHYQQTISNSYFHCIINNISTLHACKNIANKDEKNIKNSTSRGYFK